VSTAIRRTCSAGVVAAVAALGCSGGKKSPPTGVAGDAGATDAAMAIDAAVDAAIAAPRLEPLPAGTKVPGGLKIGARVVGGGRFVDRDGEKFIYLVERATRDRSGVSLFAVHELGKGADARRLRELTDVAEGCPGPSATRFVDGSLAITDADGDGVGEVWLAWIVGCGTDEEPLAAKQLVLEGKDRYVIRGEGAFDGVTEPDAASWPAGWHERALAGYEAAAATLTPSPAAAQVLTGEDFAAVETDQISYPDLAPLPAPLAAELTTRMTKFLRDEGDCFVGLVTPEVVSLSCRRGDTRATFTYWRERALPTIDPAELVGADRLQRLCGDGARPRFVLDRDGLRWVPDTNHAPPDDCPDGVEWGDMQPTSARARALVGRHIAAAEP
jgi:hypothetical protein